MFPTEVPYAVYFDKAGAPLDNGYLYFGVENQNPETSSLQVFWDLAGTQPVAQPVRTIAGFPVRAGTIANIYANAAYSQTVRDSKGNLVSYSASSTARNPFGGTTSFALTDTEAISTTTSSFRFTRNANYPGGTPGYVNACVIGETFVNNAAASAFEWAGLFVVHNAATGGQNVGSYSQGNKLSGAGPTWGSVSEVIDQNTTPPTSGAVGLEVDVRANTLDPNQCRVIVDAVYSRQGLAGANMAAYYGVRIQDAGDHAGAVLGTGFGFGAGCVVGIGLDTSPATITGAAIKMAQGQVIQFNNAIGAAVRQLYYNGGGLILQNTTGTSYWALNDGGTLNALGKQLLSAGAQQTGWVAMTGALDHTTAFPVATATAAQIASRLAAIEFVMLQHGLIHV